MSAESDLKSLKANKKKIGNIKGGSSSYMRFVVKRDQEGRGGGTFEKKLFLTFEIKKGRLIPIMILRFFCPTPPPQKKINLHVCLGL